MVLIYPAVLYPFTDGSGGYVVEFPDLQGCVTEGRNLEEAILMGTDAASGWIHYMMQYADMMEKLQALDDDDLSTAEAVYYVEVMSRIEQKLLKVSM